MRSQKSEGLKRSIEYTLLLKELTHAWEDVDDVIERITRKLSPGMCLRAYQNRSGVSKVSNSNPRIYTEDQQISFGARILINLAIHSAVTCNIVQIRHFDSRRDREVRLNRFDADYVQNIIDTLSSQVDDQLSSTEHVCAPPTFIVKQEIVSLKLNQLMLDHKNVKRDVEIKPNIHSSQVEMTIKDISDNQDLSIHLSPTAADWISDQLGFQSVVVRNGEINAKKALLPTDEMY